jgi:hypothetical protein
MRAFFCDVCGQRLYFENSRCLTCKTAQGFVPVRLQLHPLGDNPRCANAGLAECNWVAGAGELCFSCALTKARPDPGDEPEVIADYANTERAKRWLLYGLLHLGLPIGDDLGFELLSSSKEAVITGHADGIVTIDLAESDPAKREARRTEFGEPYRTLLGHFRHEIGHYFQPHVVDDWDACRALFGDERADYQAAIDAHYANGAPPDWPEEHVSAYATMHPWEDWAETFAHYLHITDTLETAEAFGLTAAPVADTIDAIIDTWLPLTYALNQVNRSMGQGDLYPFTLAPRVISKLGFVHGCVLRARVQDQRR